MHVVQEARVCEEMDHHRAPGLPQDALVASSHHRWSPSTYYPFCLLSGSHVVSSSDQFSDTYLDVSFCFERHKTVSRCACSLHTLKKTTSCRPPAHQLAVARPQPEAQVVRSTPRTDAAEEVRRPNSERGPGEQDNSGEYWLVRHADSRFPEFGLQVHQPPAQERPTLCRRDTRVIQATAWTPDARRPWTLQSNGRPGDTDVDVSIEVSDPPYS